MRNKKMLLLPVLLSLPLTLGAAGSRASTFNPSDLSGSHTIKIINLEDYIFIDEEDSSNDLIHQFERYANDKYGLNDVEVVYITSDTNESVYNDLLTGRMKYDLVCTSDYMLQKFAREGLIERLSEEEIEFIDNYNTYSSTAIKNRLDEIQVEIDGETVNLREFSVGYMWGTLGLLLRPDFSTYARRDIAPEKVIEDAQSWDILWNKDYYNTASIKNSMRDTYAVGLMHGYDSKLEALKDELNAKIEVGTVTEEDKANYNKELERIFNLTDDDTLQMVDNEFYTLRQNIFGLEVDSGKLDIVTGKIGLNLAWSGDAVYAMDQGDEEDENGNPLAELYYSVPENGSNIWFDGWAIPTNVDRDPGTKLLALEFLNFISDPENASQNMDYTGYTSFIGGDDILELTYSYYDVRDELVHYYDEEEEPYKIGYVDPITNRKMIAKPSICFDINEPNAAYDEVPLYYLSPTGELDEEGEEIYEEIPLLDEEDNQIYFNDQFGFEKSEYEEVDLSYFFNGSLEGYEDDIDTIFYTDCYLPFEGNVSVGRQFFCQFPNEETILRCSVMRDYGDDNLKVVKLWESSKGTPLPVWGIVILSVIAASGIGLAIYISAGQRIKKKLRVARKGTK